MRGRQTDTLKDNTRVHTNRKNSNRPEKKRIQQVTCSKCILAPATILVLTPCLPGGGRVCPGRAAWPGAGPGSESRPCRCMLSRCCCCWSCCICRSCCWKTSCWAASCCCCCCCYRKEEEEEGSTEGKGWE